MRGGLVGFARNVSRFDPPRRRFGGQRSEPGRDCGSRSRSRLARRGWQCGRDAMKARVAHGICESHAPIANDVGCDPGDGGSHMRSAGRRTARLAARPAGHSGSWSDGARACQSGKSLAGTHGGSEQCGVGFGLWTARQAECRLQVIFHTPDCRRRVIQQQVRSAAITVVGKTNAACVGHDHS
jgi:hypothetical protein